MDDVLTACSGGEFFPRGDSQGRAGCGPCPLSIRELFGRRLLLCDPGPWHRNSQDQSASRSVGIAGCVGVELTRTMIATITRQMAAHGRTLLCGFTGRLVEATSQTLRLLYGPPLYIKRREEMGGCFRHHLEPCGKV